jgi:serine/threonine-protein kinase
MPLNPGNRLGPYEILAPIGAGGMGEVYQARDTKLGREVAIKVLPEAFQTEERLARFEREARVLASLNHPNIAAIYGLEEIEDVHFLVLELVPGQTLARRLRSGPMPLKEALPLFHQMAEGLEAAHEKGILHRDLKPANIKITPDGKLKVLDFGLAKVFESDTASEISESPTITREGTATGIILGTAAYMSPEQARGQPLDKRTDIWSFGCVLYEALTGKPAFLGGTVSDTVAKILEREPDWKALPKETPAAVHHLLRRSLQKDRARRLRDVGDVGIEIEDSQSGALATVPPAASKSESWSNPNTIMKLAGIAVALVATVLVLWPGEKVDQQRALQVTRLEWSLPEGQNLERVAMSRDGEHLVYRASTTGEAMVYRGSTNLGRRLYHRRLDQFDVVPINGTEGAQDFDLSPDGRWAVFWSRPGRLSKVPLDGGPAVTIAEPIVVDSPVWGHDDMIYYNAGGTTGDSGLMRISADGREPEKVTELDESKGEWTHRYPDVLPGGKAVVFTFGESGMTGWHQGKIGVVSLETGERRTLIDGSSFARYIDGFLIYIADGGILRAAPFDLDRLEITGEAEPVVEEVLWAPSGGLAHFAVSKNGTLVYASGPPVGEEPLSLLWVDRAGQTVPITDERRGFRNPALSPDEQRLAIEVVQKGKHDLWTYDNTRDAFTRLTHEARDAFSPIWTPDGQQITYMYGVRPFPVYSIPSDGSGQSTQLIKAQYDQRPHSWSSDGKRLVVSEDHPETGWDLLLYDSGSGRTEPFLQTQFNESGGMVSPERRWLAYVSDDTGRSEIYVTLFPKAGRKWQISTNGGDNPRWTRNGQELIYRNDDKWMAVPIRTTDGFVPGKPRLLFQGNYKNRYAATADGERFVVVEKAEAPRRINVVFNWVEELKEKFRD